MDLDGDEGAAAVAPAVEGPEVVVQGPANFNIFHGEGPPHLLEQDLPAERTPRVKQDPTTELIRAAAGTPEPAASSARKEEPSEASNSAALPVDSGIGDAFVVDYGAGDDIED